MVFYYFFKKIVLNSTPDIYLLLLCVRGECQHVVQTRKTGGICGARPPLPSDTITRNSWDELSLFRMWFVADSMWGKPARSVLDPRLALRFKGKEHVVRGQAEVPLRAMLPEWGQVGGLTGSLKRWAVSQGGGTDSNVVRKAADQKWLLIWHQ